MNARLRSFLFSGFVSLTATSLLAAVDAPAPGPNSDPTYQQLRNLTLGPEAVAVNGLDLRREAATFHLRSGTICFVGPVQGKVTGAVFVGDGNFVLAPASPAERSMLKLLTKENEFSENFNEAVFRFTDSTYDELKKSGSPAPSACNTGLLRDSQNATRRNHLHRFNLDARILEDVLGTAPGKLFLAFVRGKRYSDKELFAIDPHSSSDQVELTTYDENKAGVWIGLNFPDAQRNRIHIEHQQLDTTIEKSANLIGKATTTFVSEMNGLRVLPFDLFRSLRVERVTAEGQALPFIQEDKNEDADFVVILPKALAEGEKYTITTAYSGKEAVTNEGRGNYYPVARGNWYPNNVNAGLGEYTRYDMTFHIPKGMKIAATGTLLSENNDGAENVTVWRSEAPQTVAGFNFGRVKMQEVKLTKPDYLVQSMANEDPPDWVRDVLRESSSSHELPTYSGIYGASPGMSSAPLGTMDTTGMIKHALAEAQVSIQLYSDYFGLTPYKRVAMTQQTACTFGQSWPSLVWLPTCSFFDTTVRHSLGLDFGDRGYWRVVGPHEIAHQWWGHTVGFSSYRDQWMSEGFADFSASLYLQNVYAKDPRVYLNFWKDEHELITQRNKEGFRAIDAGPLTMGYRLNNSKVGVNVYRDLIYPKGAYVLHMIRMMMWSAKAGDDDFKAMMQDFVRTYSGKSASTEDFKAIVEKHMTPQMDVQGNRKMDWFFNEYVYGTALPSYVVDSSFEKDSSGGVVLSLKLTQSGVDDHFVMLVPIYLELADSRVILIGRAPLTGNDSLEQKVPLRGLKTAPKRALINYNYDVLASN